MSRRIEVELTSTRPDGNWTWRSAGAREPKGELDGAIVPEDVTVGDVVKVDADFLIDGIEILAVLPKKPARSEPERLEVLGTGDPEPGVTTELAPKRGRGRRERGDGGGRPKRGDGGGGQRREKGGGRSERDGEKSRRRPRSEGSAKPHRDDRPAKPKPKKIRAKRVHRSEVLASVPEEQRPIAEEVLRGGMPAVRQAIETQNAGAREAGRPEVDPAPLLTMAEHLLPALKAAEWHDRADAAKGSLDEISLTDLRSVVVAADGNTRSEESRALAEELKVGLAQRVEREQAEWLAELKAAVAEGRTVRALRLSSRPPKAGTPLPPDLLTALAEQASAGLTPEVSSQRWGTVVDAVSYSPARAKVVPVGIPAEPSEELVTTITKMAGRVPEIAALFGISASSRRRSRRKPPPPPVSRGDTTEAGEQAEAVAQAPDADVQPEPPESPVTGDTEAAPDVVEDTEPVASETVNESEPPPSV